MRYRMVTIQSLILILCLTIGSSSIINANLLVDKTYNNTSNDTQHKDVKLNQFKFDIDKTVITVSGVSAGAFFAVQMHVAFSKQITGVASFAGGPYYCSQGVIEFSDYCMSLPWFIDLDQSYQYASDQSKKGKIDPLENLKNSQVWLYSGTYDTVVDPEVVQDQASFYQQYNANITTKYNIPSEHAWIAENNGQDCDFLGGNYVNKCSGFDSINQLLSKLYNRTQMTSPGIFTDNNLFKFDQTPYFKTSDGLNELMSNNGFIYVPTSCQAGKDKCTVHISLHGCEMNEFYTGSYFFQNSGLNQYAETNNIIILYPQVATTVIVNELACFDWWGYTSNDYANQNGYQMTAVNKMLQELINDQ